MHAVWGALLKARRRERARTCTDVHRAQDIVTRRSVHPNFIARPVDSHANAVITRSVPRFKRGRDLRNVSCVHTAQRRYRLHSMHSSILLLFSCFFLFFCIPIHCSLCICPCYTQYFPRTSRLLICTNSWSPFDGILQSPKENGILRSKGRAGITRSSAHFRLHKCPISCCVYDSSIGTALAAVPWLPAR